MSISKLGALIHSHPEEAEKQILDAMRDARCDRKTAATALNTTHRSLYRFIDRLDLWAKIDTMIEESGFPKIPGPPRSRDRIREAVLNAGGALARAATALDMDRDILEKRLTSLGMWADLNSELEARGRRPMRVPEGAVA